MSTSPESLASASDSGGRSSEAKDKLARLTLTDEQRQTARPEGRRRRISLITAAGLVSVLVAVVAFDWLVPGDDTAPEAGGPTANMSVAELRAAVPTTKPIASGFTAGGFVEARRLADLSPAIDGVVQEINVALGSFVSQGDVILALDADSLRAEVDITAADLVAAEARLRLLEAGARVEEIAAAEADSKAAEAAFEDARAARIRLESLEDRSIVSEESVDQARYAEAETLAQYDAATANERLIKSGNRAEDIDVARANVTRAAADLERTKARLSDTFVYAPFDGVIVRLDTEIGEGLVAELGPTVTIADLSEIWLRVDVPENRIASVAPGDPVEAIVDAIGSQVLPATVVEISPIADRQTNTVEVAVRLDQVDPRIRPNMTGRVNFVAKTQE
jgi:HlyD family secretion protein